jgi:hypothetical protein
MNERTVARLGPCVVLALLVTAGCPSGQDPKPEPSPTLVAPSPSPRATPSPAATPRPNTPQPSPRPTSTSWSIEGDRARTALVVDLVVRSKSFDRGFEAALLFLPEMRQSTTIAFTARCQDPDARARERSMQALGEMARLRLLPDDLRPKAVEAVSSRLKGESSHAAWAEAVRALGSLMGVDAGKDVTDALGRAVEEDAGPVVRACADVLGDLQHRPAAAALAQAADRVHDKYAFRALLRALGRVGGPDAIERLKRALASADAGDREAAATALGEAAGPHAAASLKGAILRREEEPSVRRASIAALERMGGEDARRALESCLAELGDRKEEFWVGITQDVSETLDRVKRK